jgi:hypothetical protein
MLSALSTFQGKISLVVSLFTPATTNPVLSFNSTSLVQITKDLPRSQTEKKHAIENRAYSTHEQKTFIFGSPHGKNYFRIVWAKWLVNKKRKSSFIYRSKLSQKDSSALNWNTPHSLPLFLPLHNACFILSQIHRHHFMALAIDFSHSSASFCSFFFSWAHQRKLLAKYEREHCSIRNALCIIIIPSRAWQEEFSLSLCLLCNFRAGWKKLSSEHENIGHNRVRSKAIKTGGMTSSFFMPQGHGQEHGWRSNYGKSRRCLTGGF